MDSYLVQRDEAVKLALFLVQLGRIDKVTLVSQAKLGKIPSGFDNAQGPIRVSWLEHEYIAADILAAVKELEKETKETVGKVEEPEPVPVVKKPIPTKHYPHKKKYKK